MLAQFLASLDLLLPSEITYDITFVLYIAVEQLEHVQ